MKKILSIFAVAVLSLCGGKAFAQRNLPHGDTTSLAVRLVSLKIFAAERPCIGIVTLDDRVEYSEVIATVSGVADIETVYHVGTDFDLRHSGEDRGQKSHQANRHAGAGT